MGVFQIFQPLTTGIGTTWVGRVGIKLKNKINYENNKIPLLRHLMKYSNLLYTHFVHIQLKVLNASQKYYL